MHLAAIVPEGTYPRKSVIRFWGLTVEVFTAVIRLADAVHASGDGKTRCTVSFFFRGWDT